MFPFCSSQRPLADSVELHAENVVVIRLRGSQLIHEPSEIDKPSPQRYHLRGTTSEVPPQRHHLRDATSPMGCVHHARGAGGLAID